MESSQQAPLPDALDLRLLGLDPRAIRRAELLGGEHGSALYRVEGERGTFVLKWYPEPEQATEVQAYALLAENSVPTLPVHGRTESALLLEDLAASPTWRLAEQADVERGETGAALAEWYLALHRAGRSILARGAPGFLAREIDGLDAAAVFEIGSRLGLLDDPVWALAAENVGMLTEAFRSLPETLNYNDFHWSNLALSRQAPLRAIVFDYHLLGIGPAYCDWRNAAYSLGEQAKAAFGKTYGPLDEREAILDAPLSLLVGLRMAIGLPRLPRWADDLVGAVRSGDLERSLRRALDLV